MCLDNLKERQDWVKSNLKQTDRKLQSWQVNYKRVSIRIAVREFFSMDERVFCHFRGMNCMADFVPMAF